ncbi:DUF2628 domain-containing protein [Psychrobacillus psychrodurans]|uniref:DUF2628 domain-containing protein n=1 Tax=Psychrobacillus psychrodurans TaxID=126157 RepID=A0A9X3L9H6_9BACI|nr:DUF2628 domain-containing protein [Psychrobacillus psychrodurans]MCZ8531999.1 DUF2628 domain-containing protein [Psychrobacillus psychrodurans]
MNTWNWVAFFFPLFWFGYRKMYKPIFSILGISIVINLLGTVLGIDEVILNTVIGLAVSFTVGITGNNFYRLHALKRTREMSESNISDVELLKNEIQLRGGTSWKGVFGTIVLIGVYLLIVMNMGRFVLTNNKITESEPDYNIEFEIKKVLEDNIQALENENMDEYMSMVYTHAEQTTFAETKKMLSDLFENFDLAYELKDFEFLSISEQEVKVRVTQITTLVEGENFQDNESIFIHILKPQKEEWKFFNSEVESIKYLAEDQSVKTNSETISNEPSYITALQAPSMFDFFITKKIDVNNDGILETISFRGGPEESSSYSNNNVEIIVELDDTDMTSLTISAENAPILYFYDINHDGWMEIFYETGARIIGTEMYQFTPDGLAKVTTLNGSVVKFNPNEVITSEYNYIFDKSLIVSN